MNDAEKEREEQITQDGGENEHGDSHYGGEGVLSLGGCHGRITMVQDEGGFGSLGGARFFMATTEGVKGQALTPPPVAQNRVFCARVCACLCELPWKTGRLARSMVMVFGSILEGVPRTEWVLDRKYRVLGENAMIYLRDRELNNTPLQGITAVILIL